MDKEQIKTDGNNKQSVKNFRESEEMSFLRKMKRRKKKSTYSVKIGLYIWLRETNGDLAQNLVVFWP